MLHKGDRVVYPHHGAAVIEELVERVVDGERRTYFKIHIASGDLTLMVPVDNTEQVGLRQVVPKGDVPGVFHLLGGEGVWPVMNWSRRYKENMSKLTSGDIYQGAELVRDLSWRERTSGLASSERAMLAKARKILVSELVFALECPEADAEARLDTVLAEPR